MKTGRKRGQFPRPQLLRGQFIVPVSPRMMKCRFILRCHHHSWKILQIIIGQFHLWMAEIVIATLNQQRIVKRATIGRSHSLLEAVARPAGSRVTRTQCLNRNRRDRSNKTRAKSRLSSVMMNIRTISTSPLSRTTSRPS